MVMRLCLAICWADRASRTGSWALIGDILLTDVDQEAENGIELLSFKYNMGKSTTAHSCVSTTVAAFT